MFEGYDVPNTYQTPNVINDTTRLEKIWMLELERISNNIAFLGRIPNGLRRER